MDVSDYLEDDKKEPTDNYTLTGRSVGLLGGILGCGALLAPNMRLEATISASGIASHTESTNFTLGEVIGLMAYSDPMNGAILAILAVGGAVLAAAGSMTIASLTAVGGAMMSAGSVFMAYQILNIGDVGFSYSILDLSIGGEPAYGMILLGVAGIFSLISIRL
ncbi:hypothetical protein JCM18237_28310 [Halorubrum luteum]